MSILNCRLATLDDVAQLVDLRILMQKEVNPSNAEAIDPGYPDAVRRYFDQEISSRSYVSAVAELNG